MGFGADVIDGWEPYQFVAARRGWIAANCPPQGPSAPTDDEFRAAVARTMH